MTNRILSIFASFLILLSITIVPAVAAPSGNENVAVIIESKDKSDAALTQQNINIFQIFENDFITTSGDEYVPGEFIVKFKPDIGKNVIAEINSKQGASIKRAGQHFVKLNVPQGKTVSQMVESYSKNPNVEYAEANYIVHTHMVPDDQHYHYQWHLDIPTSKEISGWHGENGGGINIEPAWDMATGTGVVVAVIDTGVAYEKYRRYAQAPDLANTNFVPGYDFVNNDNHPNDDAGHGTHVTGIIAQSTNNGIGVAGVAFDCSIMPIKVLDSKGYGTHSWIAEGIHYAADNGAQVISMSLGGTDNSTTLENALAYAHGKNVTIVCSAGNDGAGAPPSYPAAYDAYCIAVGATGYNETVSYYSTTGNYVDIAAPGGDMNVDQNVDGYVDGVLQQTHNGVDYTKFGYYFYQGTSMAAPHVSGVAALLISNGITGPDNVRDAMESTAEDKGDSGLDPEYGWGIVDAYAALQWSATPNSPPEAYDQSVTTNEDTFVSITLNATDSDGDSLVYSIISAPSHGTLTGAAPDVIYTPDVDYNGADSFTFRANDDMVDSNTATVSITVSAINDAPTASDQSVTTPENTSVNITLAATDVDGDVLTYSIVDAPSNGTVTLSGNNATYTPSENYNGVDSFTFKANDGTVDSNTAMVSITVSAANDAPTASDQSLTTPEDTSVNVTLTATDVDGDSLTYSIVDAPSNGTVTLSSNKATYTPNANYNGADSFTFKANDGTVDSNTATVSITVSAVNDAPTASDLSVTTPENTSVNITLAAIDVDGDSLTYSIVDAPFNGTVTLSGNKATYTPFENYNGVDSFTFRANDSTIDSNTATVSITVTEAVAPANTMHIASIDVSTTIIRLRGWYTYATTKIMIVDAAGIPVEGAKVSGQWSGLTTDSDSRTTDDDGTVALKSNLVKNAAGTFTFTVTDVVLADWTYNATANVKDFDSTTV